MEWNDTLSPQSFSLIAFDLDDTLTESKQALDADMAELLKALLQKKKIAIISGASLSQLQEQVLNYLQADDNLLANLYLLPTNGAKLYSYQASAWQLIYHDEIAAEDKKRILAAFDETFRQTHFVQSEKIYGSLIEDRGSQMTFSGLGSEAPLTLKKTWDPDRQKRQILVKILAQKLPDFAIGMGGMTSIDVTKKGIDKAYGLKRLAEYLQIPLTELLYVGDALFPDGNDAPVLVLPGAYYWAKGGVSETKHFIQRLLQFF